MSPYLDQGGAAARHRWPGVSGGLCLARPARRTPGRFPRIATDPTGPSGVHGRVMSCNVQLAARRVVSPRLWQAIISPGPQPDGTWPRRYGRAPRCPRTVIGSQRSPPAAAYEPEGAGARGRRRGRTGLAGETGQDEIGTRGVRPRIWRTAPRLACGAPSVTHEKPQGLGLWAIYRHRDRAGWHARRVVGRTVIAR